MEWSVYDKQVLPTVFLYILLFSIALGLLLRRCSPRIRAIPMAVLALALLFIEIVKQRWNLLGEFDYYNLPLHYCSMFIPVYLLAELGGVRLARIFRPIGVYMSFVVTVGLYMLPKAIIGSGSEFFGQTFKATHTMLMHHFVVAYLVLSIALRLYRPRLRDTLYAGAVGIAYVALALPLAYRFDANYCNFLKNVVPALENIRLAHGQVFYTVLVALALTIGMALGSALYYGLYRAVALLVAGVRRIPWRKETKK